MAELIDLYQAGRDYATDAGRQAVADLCKRLKRDLGHLAVAEFAAPVGAQTLRRYRDRLWEEGLKGKTVRNILGQLLGVLEWGQADARELTGPIPKMPDPCRRDEILTNPRFEFFTESDFRKLREHAFDGCHLWASWHRKWKGDKAAISDYIARRKLYLSFAFYTGLHNYDLDRIRGEQVSAEMGRYERCNHKSAKRVRPAWFTMPEQLRLDVQAELDRRGLPAFPPRELICGGEWIGATEPLQNACKRLALSPPWTFRIARRSTAREYTVRGWSSAEIAAVLGHVDTRMVDEIYRRCDELGLVSPVRVPWTCSSGPGGGPTRTGSVLKFAAIK
jgi:hypothetical protein